MEFASLFKIKKTATHSESRPDRSVEEKKSGLNFSWVDGPLVTAMRRGHVFLADEISLGTIYNHQPTLLAFLFHDTYNRFYCNIFISLFLKWVLKINVNWVVFFSPCNLSWCLDSWVSSDNSAVIRVETNMFIHFVCKSFGGKYEYLGF